MANRLSHSSTTTYQTCGKKYYFHYVKRYRERFYSSALVFGGAFDKAAEEMFHGRDEISMFTKVFSFSEFNKRTIYIPDSPIVRYYDADIVLYILQDEDKEKLNTWLKTNTPETRNWDVVFSEVSDLKRDAGYNNLSELKLRFYNYVAWHCLYRKGLLMLAALRTQVLSKLVVIETQKEIKFKIGTEGDSAIGFVDLIAQWGPLQNDVVVFDVKTASRPYEADAVTTSAQLACYSETLAPELQTRKAGFIVIVKKLIDNKTKTCSVCNFDGSGTRFANCNNETPPAEGAKKPGRCGGAWIEGYKPEVMIQVLINDIPESFAKLVVNNYDDINAAIKAGVFTRNLDSCIQGYGPCAFYAVCHKNDESGVVKMEEVEQQL